MTVADNETRSMRMRRHERKLTAYIVGTAMVVGVMVLLFWQYVFVTILPGHVGVLYSWLFGGTRVETIYGEGLALKLPWNRIYIFEIRTQTRDDRVIALSSEGLEIGVELSTLFRVRAEQAGDLLQTVGPDYEERIVRPVAIGAVREVISRYSTNELYTIDFNRLESDLYEEVRSSPYADLLDFRKLLIRQLVLPEQLLDAIEHKLTEEQRAAAYIFRLERERQEAQRRQIEALGIRNFYAIVSSALTENLLTWRGIEATVELSRSPNSKIVIVGSGEGQLPLILGSDIHNLPPPAATAPLTPEEMPELDWNELPRLFPEPEHAKGVNAPAKGVITGPITPRDSGQPPTAEPPSGQPPASQDGAQNQQTQSGLMGGTASTDGLAPQADNDGLTAPGGVQEGFFRLPSDGTGGAEPTAQPYGQRSD